MILPYSDNQPLRRPLATLGLLAATFALSLWLLLCGWQGRAGEAAPLPALVGLVPDHFRFLNLLTYPLFHDSLGHLLVNAFFLWVFGAGIEAAVGSRLFLLLYFLGGLVGGALQCIVTATLLPPEYQAIPIVGASAACAGLIGLYAVRYYRASINFVGLPFRAHVVVVVTLYLILEIGGGLWNLLAGNNGDGVAHWAHIGGFVFGLGCAYLLHLVDHGERAYLSLDALQAMSKSVPGAAIKKWEILLTRDPGNVEARVELARAWLMLGDKEHAQGNYALALVSYLEQQGSVAATLLVVEMREAEPSITHITPAQRLGIGLALDELQQYAQAAELLQNLGMEHSDAPEAETALLKTALLYAQRLGRRDDALIFLRLFVERYPNSPQRKQAEEWQRAVTSLSASPKPLPVSIESSVPPVDNSQLPID